MAETRLAEYQFTREEAISLAGSGSWKNLSPTERGLMQLRQQLLCMDFSAFHEGIEALMGRPVFTHEMAYPDRLWDEYQRGEVIDFEAVMAKLPHHAKVIVVGIDPHA